MKPTGQSLQVTVQGKRALVAAAAAGTVRVTLAFDEVANGPGQCASVVQPFRTIGRNKGIRFP